MRVPRRMWERLLDVGEGRHAASLQLSHNYLEVVCEPSDKGVVYLYRTGKAVGAAGQIQVKVNGLDAGGTGPGSFFRWELTPGAYVFSSFTGESSAVVEVDVKAGEIYYVEQNARIGLNSGRVNMKVVSDSKGQQEIAGYKLLLSTYRPD